MNNSQLLEREQTLISVVDMQEKLAAAMAERNRVIANARKLILTGLRLGVPMVVTEQYPKGLGPTVPELVEDLAEQYAPIEKLAFGCCSEPAYMERLEASGRKRIILCGMETHVCVLQTCMVLLENGMDVHVAADAVCSRDPEHRQIGLDQMAQAGAVITCVEAVVFQLLGRAGTPEFKDVLKFVK